MILSLANKITGQRIVSGKILICSSANLVRKDSDWSI